MLGKIAYDESYVFRNFSHSFELKGKRVIEVGGCLPEQMVIFQNVEEWVSIDPRNPQTKRNGKYSYIAGIASSIPVEDNYFDFVFSCNAFEHINDLPDTIAELKRVLKPGGIIYAHYGPIWSGPDGHHIEYIELENRTLNFWEDYVIPHWAHLVFTEEELTNLLCRTFSKEDALKISYSVFNAEWVNRLSFEDYIQIFMGSGMRLCHLETTEEVDYPYIYPDYGVTQEDVLNRVESKFENKRNIKCRDMLVVLIK